MREIVQHHRFAGLDAMDIARQQSDAFDIRQCLDQTAADQLVAAQSEIITGGPVYITEDQIDHAAAGSGPHDEHLRIQHRVGVGPDQGIRTIRGIDGFGQRRVVVEGPDASV